MALSSALLVVGYGGTWAAFHGYLDGFGEGNRLVMLIILGYLTGAGAAASMVAALSLTANSFSKTSRATAAAAVLAAFALSALFYTSIGRLLPDPKAQSYLALLASLPAMSQLGCWICVRKVNLLDGDVEVQERTGYERLSSETVVPAIYDIGDSDDDEDVSEAETERGDGNPRDLPVHHSSSSLHPNTNSTDPLDSLEGGPNRLSIHQTTSTHRLLPRSASRHSQTSKHHHSEDIGGFQLLARLDFWILFAVFLILSGIGLMYINNVGTIVHEVEEESEAEKWQGYAVGAISLFNCLGRALSGYLTDHFHSKYHLSRTTFIFLPPFLFLLSLSFLLHSSAILISSCLMGLSYGSLFAIGPLLIMEWFGLRCWTLNMGLLLLSPIPGSNIFSLLFGRMYDHRRGSCEEMGCFEPTLLTARAAAVGALVIIFSAAFFLTELTEISISVFRY
ncbi:MFS general substrate transporter [Atractiella rhizophila]|nr:MFS general substrate transporter [Atractiella rhizophila]